jgi:hypothetical protein
LVHGRRYALLERATGTEAGLCVIDGAGNWPGLTATLAKAADLVLTPAASAGRMRRLPWATWRRSPPPG